MGEFVGVNPVNLAELAKRLQRLHEVLIRNGPIIQQNMQQWGSDVSFAPLPRLIDSALNDTRDMDARTTKAHGLANENGWDPAPLSELLSPGRRPSPANKPGFIGPRSPYVQLDWATTGESGYQAEQDVQAMKDALTGTDPEAVRVSLSGVREHLTQHLNDKPYLAAFWAQAAPLALQAARALYNRTGTTLFSAESVSILRALGSSLAAAGQMRVGTGKDSRPLLSPQARAAITRSSDPWSVGMLFKYGPDGKSWDSHFLAEVTRSMLDARAAGKVHVPIPPDHGGILDRDRALYQKRIADFDPVLAVMERATQNGRAARHVLGDPDSGLKYAKMLVSDDWHTPGVKVGPYGKASGADPSLTVDRIDLTSHAAEFLKAAVSAPRGASDDAKESAWSVVHIVQATSEFTKLHPDKILPHEIRQSLIYTADRYLPDFAMGVTRPYGSGAVPLGDVDGNPWVSVIDGTQLADFFNKTLGDPEEFGRFKGMLDARISTAVTATIKDPSDANYLSEMAGLYGLIERVQADRRFAEGELKDEQATRNQVALAAVTGGFGAISFTNPWGPGTITQFLTGSATPVASELFDTDNALKALKNNADAFRSQVFHVEIPVIQGLVNAGVLHPPENASWFSGGQVSANPALTAWLSQHTDTKYGDKTLGEWVKEAQIAMRFQQ
ncbi:hypothetical protein ACFHYQ_17705 [Sphaerimonospora cavernae]|uniref:Uncharacterized protein n=1 Tax=Sphaerimonospora cavernae TaxID=1740611 RepID=A0ABV6U6Q6_9ACTN